MGLKNRIQVVDALRGFAIVSIMLLHNIEHFDFYFTPSDLPAWVSSLDQVVWDTLFFLFGGKSYAIFALLFGLTFFIQSNNEEKRGKGFRGRFAWRLLLLLGFGLINSAFYEGDILLIYAILGFFLIPAARLSDKAVFWSALLLLLQPVEWINVIIGMKNPDMHIADPASWAYFGKAGEYIPGNSFINTLAGNLTNGKIAVFLWTWEEGRVFQIVSLFMFGMLAGRKLLFTSFEERKPFWIKTLVLSTIIFVILYIIKTNLEVWIGSEAIYRPLRTIETSWTNMAFMLVLVSGFVLLYNTRVFYRLLNSFSSLGRMSLSNYIMQSITGSFIYYGFGLGLYQYTGATYCLFIGIILALAQGYFSWWWMKKYKQGPLETFWHKATWVGPKSNYSDGAKVLVG